MTEYSIWCKVFKVYLEVLYLISILMHLGCAGVVAALGIAIQRLKKRQLLIKRTIHSGRFAVRIILCQEIVLIVSP